MKTEADRNLLAEGHWDTNVCFLFLGKKKCGRSRREKKIVL